MLAQRTPSIHRGRVDVESIVENYVTFSANINSVKANNNVFSNSASNQWGGGIAVDKARECTVHYSVDHVTAGDTVATVTAQVQLWNANNSVWENFGSTISVISSFTVPSGGGPNSLAILALAAPLGGYWRIGLSCATAGTSSGGNFSITVELKG